MHRTYHLTPGSWQENLARQTEHQNFVVNATGVISCSGCDHLVVGYSGQVVGYACPVHRAAKEEGSRQRQQPQIGEYAICNIDSEFG